MRAGVSFPSYAREAVWSSTSGAWSADYPVTNVGLLDQPRRVAKGAYVSGQNIIGVFPVNRLIDFVALVHHNIPAGAAGIYVTLYSDAAMTAVAAVIPLVFPAPGPFLQVTPTYLPAPIMVRAVRYEIPNPGVVLSIGAVEAGRFWAWDDVDRGREFGLETATEVSQVAGVDHVTQQWAGRVASGSRELVDQNELDTTLLDFQLANGRHRAFVWCDDIHDPATWSRHCFLATNADLTPGRVDAYDAGRMAFSFREHLR